jgi:hypothetical protein
MLHDVLSEPYINSVLSSRRALDADLKALQREMTQIKYKERPTAEECAERIRSIIATHCG